MAIIAAINSCITACHIAVRSAGAQYNSPKEVSSELAIKTCDEALVIFDSNEDGPSHEEAANRLKENGRNILSTKQPPRWWQLALKAFLDYFNILLLIIAIVSVAVPDPEWAQFAVIMGIICLSCVVRLWEESWSAAAAVKLLDAVSTNVRAMRQKPGIASAEEMIDERDLVPGDIMFIDQGNTIPADCLIISATNLSIGQSSLTGESEPQRKTASLQKSQPYETILELQNIAFKGTNAMSGSGWGLVLKTGDDAFIATIMTELNKKQPLNAFQRGIRNISIMMIVAIAILFPIVLVVNGFVKHNWIEAVTFSLSVGVGLLPSMLPAIVNANLARRAFVLIKKNAILKSLDSVQCLGAMSVLCSDKTGTLTKDEINLCQYINPRGVEASEVYELAHTNARYQSGKKNSIGNAILKHSASEKVKIVQNRLGEIPFSFETRRSSCVTLEDNGTLKSGYDGGGLLTFLDPPKDDAKASIDRLQELGINVRCLTRDNLGVAVKICRDLDLVKDVDDQHIQAITGPELAKLEDTDEFHETVKHCKIFAKLTPGQKGQVVDSLKNRHNKVVGMLGDGINDCIALRAADTGISVHTGQNVAKDCADIILTKKGLSIIVDCILTGRVTMGNTIKYIKMGFCANLGNIISILVSSAWLPFPPMTSLQILVSNILYETSQLTMPWTMSTLPTLPLPKPDPAKHVDVAKFQTYWFLQNLVTATLIVYLLRMGTSSLSFKSRPAKSVVLSTSGIMVVGVVMPYIRPLAGALGMAKPDVTFWGWLAMEMGYYVVVVEAVKWGYVRWFGRWL
ncbi:MG transport ATPase [Halenospora varia]|nr:MG transport ATPase [Halenospora varia]